MFDVNLDSAKCYLKELERQATAYRRPQGTPQPSAGSTSWDMGPDTFTALFRRLSVRALAAAQSVAAVVF